MKTFNEMKNSEKKILISCFEAELNLRIRPRSKETLICFGDWVSKNRIFLPFWWLAGASWDGTCPCQLPPWFWAPLSLMAGCRCSGGKFPLSTDEGMHGNWHTHGMASAPHSPAISWVRCCLSMAAQGCPHGRVTLSKATRHHHQLARPWRPWPRVPLLCLAGAASAREVPSTVHSSSKCCHGAWELCKSNTHLRMGRQEGRQGSLCIRAWSGACR